MEKLYRHISHFFSFFYRHTLRRDGGADRGVIMKLFGFTMAAVIIGASSVSGAPIPGVVVDADVQMVDIDGKRTKVIVYVIETDFPVYMEKGQRVEIKGPVKDRPIETKTSADKIIKVDIFQRD